MADDLERTSEEPRNRYEAIKAAILRFLEREEDPEVKQKYEKSLAELINFGGDYEDKDTVKRRAEGGLLDEGGEVDEESGNEVPIGGTKEGVRDDIPAMLSEGEFVFPEDVTRYHGLEKLMTLRQEAKMGLKKMEAMGQMGNSEEATIPDDLPFTMDDLILVVGEGEPKEKDDEPIKAQAGTFVPANQQLNNMGVMGFQESMYGQQGLQNPVTTVMPQVPASSVVPTVQAPQPMTGYSAPTVPATPVQQTDFVPPVDEIYKSVKYINPTTGETMMINEYQGNPVSAVPAGFIRYDDYIAQGGKDPNEEVTGTATGTGVETAQVGGGTSDDEKRAQNQKLETMRRDKEKERVASFNALLDPNSEEFKNDDGTKLLEEYKKAKRGQAMGMALGPLSIPASLLLKRNASKIEKALIAKFGEAEAKKKIDDITIGSALKEGITSPFKTEGDETVLSNLFGKGFYDKYEAKYSVGKFLGGNDSTLQGFVRVNGMPSGFLDVRQQQHFDNAIRDGNYSTAEHFSRIAKLNQRRDDFAIENANEIKAIQKLQKGTAAYEAAFRKLKNKSTSGNMTLGDHSLEMVIEYGSSQLTALNKGKATASGSFFKPPTVNDSTPITSTDPVVTSTTTSTSIKPKPEPQPSSGAGDAAAAQALAEQKKAREAAAAARERLRAQAEKDRRRRDKEQSISRKPPSRPQLTKKEISKAKASTKKPSSGRRYGGGGKAKGGLMEKDK